MAVAELTRYFESVHYNKVIRLEVLNAVLDVENTLKCKLRRGLQFIGPQISVEGYIKKSLESISELEVIIRESRIKEAQRKKLELQSKLEAVEESLNLLRTDGSPPPVEKPRLKNMQNSKIRHQIMEEESEKTNEASEFAKKLHHEQVTRKRRQHERELEQSRHIYEELKGYDDIKQRYEAIINDQKQKKRDLLLGLAEARKAEMERRKVAEREYRASMSPAPVFLTVDERPSLKKKGELLRKDQFAGKRSRLAQPSMQLLSPKASSLKYDKIPKISSSANIKYESFVFKEEPRALRRLSVFNGDAQVPVRTKKSVAHLKNSDNPFQVHKSLYNPHIENVELSDSNRKSLAELKSSLTHYSKETSSKNTSFFDNPSDSQNELQLPKLMYGNKPLESLYDF